LVELVNVSKTYPNGVKALKNINLKIEEGDFVAVIGLSGAGKSTLLHLINITVTIIDQISGRIRKRIV
jgi:phosphonate transport system ATP-binding protein